MLEGSSETAERDAGVHRPECESIPALSQQDDFGQITHPVNPQAVRITRLVNSDSKAHPSCSDSVFCAGAQRPAFYGSPGDSDPQTLGTVAGGASAEALEVSAPPPAVGVVIPAL